MEIGPDFARYLGATVVTSQHLTNLGDQISFSKGAFFGFHFGLALNEARQSSLNVFISVSLLSPTTSMYLLLANDYHK